MKKLTLFQPNSPFFTAEQIKKIEEEYGAKYMGPWCIKGIHDLWINAMFDIFYQPNPKEGHSNYFAMFVDGKKVKICNGISAFSEQPINGIIEDGVVYVSRYRHDYVSTPKNNFIDGGRDYLRTNSDNTVEIRVIDGEFIFGVMK